MQPMLRLPEREDARSTSPIESSGRKCPALWNQLFPKVIPQRGGQNRRAGARMTAESLPWAKPKGRLSPH